MSRRLMLFSYLLLLLLGTLGLGLWVPAQTLPAGVAVSLFTIPLMFPLRGVFDGKPRAMQWLGLLSFAYFAVGVDTAFNRVGDERVFGYLVILASVTLCLSIMAYLRKHHPKQS